MTSAVVIILLTVFTYLLFTDKTSYAFQSDWPFYLFMSALVGLGLAAGICGLCGLVASDVADTEVTSQETYELVPYTLGTYQTDMYLARTISNNNSIYNFTYVIPDKGTANGDCREKNSYINYIKEGETPHLIVTKRDFANDGFKWLFWDVFETEYVFFIPEDSIIY